FADAKEVMKAFSTGHVHLQYKIKSRITERVLNEEGVWQVSTSLVETTVGRVILFGSVPAGLGFALVNQKMAKKQISQIINNCYRNVGLKETVIFADQLMYMGYRYSTWSGSSIGVNDFVIPDEKARIIGGADRSEERRVGKEGPAR